MTNRLLARSSWRFFTRHPWQSWLTLLSIALGSAVIIAVDMASQTAHDSFRRSIKVLSGDMTHEITALRGTVPDDFYRQLRVEWGYRHSAPVVERTQQQDGLSYTLLGIDPFAMPLQPGAGAGFKADDVRRLLTEPGTVIVAGDGIRVADIATVQGSSPGLSSIQLALTDAEASTLQSRLPPGLRLQSFQERQQVFAQMTQAFQTNLAAMSLLAMLVGAFLVYNTMTFSVLQRRQGFAIARMVGVTGRQLFWQLLLEAVMLGMVGSLLGVLLGWLLGQGLLVLVTRTISDLYVSVRVTDVLLSPDLALKGLGITLLAVGVATLAPAWEAAHVAPVQVSRRSGLEQGKEQRAGALAATGVVLMLLAVGLIRVSGSSLLAGFAGLFLLIVGYSLSVPLLLRLVLRAASPGRVWQPKLWLRLAVRGVQASLSRTALAVIALTVAVSATVGVSIMIGSFRNSVAEWLDMTLASDVYVSATNGHSSQVTGTLHPQWLARIQALPEVSGISTGRTVTLSVENFPVPALVLQAGSPGGRGFAFLSGNAASIWQGFLQGEGLLVSEPFAYQQDKQQGDTVSVTTELAGTVSLPVLGVFRDYSATQGMVVLSRNLYGRYWTDQGISSIGMVMAAGADASMLKQRLQGWALELQQPGEPLVVRSNRDIREASLQVFDRTFTVTHVLRLLVIIVAFVGVFSALLALFLEKGRDYAILRATGLTPQQLRNLIQVQALLMGLLAGVLALPLGWLMSWVLIDIINQRSFGWTMQTRFFAFVPLQAIGLAMGAAWLASLYPVWRIGRLPIQAGLYAGPGGRHLSVT